MSAVLLGMNVMIFFLPPLLVIPALFESDRLIHFTPKVDGFAPKPRGIDFRSHRVDGTKPCETELVVLSPLPSLP